MQTNRLLRLILIVMMLQFALTVYQSCNPPEYPVQIYDPPVRNQQMPNPDMP